MSLSRFFLRASFIFMLFVAGSFAQAQPSLRIGVNGGFVSLVSAFNKDGNQDTFTLPVKSGGLGFGPQVRSLGMAVQFKSSASTPLTWVAEFTYMPLSGSGDPGWDDSVARAWLPLWKDAKGSWYTLSLGGQWEVLQGPFQPYFGARAVYFHIPPMEILHIYTPNSPGARYSGHGGDHQVDKTTGFDCIGIGFVVGGEYDVTSHLSLELNARYQFTDPIRELTKAYPYCNVFSVNIGLLVEVLG